MTICAITIAIFAVVITVRVLFLQRQLDRLERTVQADRSAAVLARAQQVASDVERECGLDDDDLDPPCQCSCSNCSGCLYD